MNPDYPESSSELEADVIVGLASRRGLGSRPGLRRFATISWASFLGASCMLPVWLLVGDDCLHTPVSMARVAEVFAICFVLAAVPASAMSLLECRQVRGA